ncbi:MAG TPA: carboxypeptidase-like regulatory domain-containing protein [Terriglobales bacterium]|nr:carboxypeptidase-like regulatory domain-containing protein [Terriglobales bacterium]
MPSPRFWAFFTFVAVVIFASVSLYGQSTYGSITGTVFDPTGAAVPDAQVTLTNVSTTERRTQPTNADGLYAFPNLAPGQYRIDVEKVGFKKTTRTLVVVEVQQTTRIDVSLTVGQVSESVEVTSETPLLQTETSSLGQVIEERKATELPLNGRNIYNLITLSPAAVAQGGSGGTPVGENPFSWGNYQVGGSFANESAEYLDGQPLNIGYINLPILIPIQDSVGEFKVQYNNVGADWGKYSGGVVNFSTKSGSNSFHGEVYEFLRNKILNANEYFNKQTELLAGKKNEQPPYVQNQYGFNVGGPVVKNKLFFFGSWEEYRQRTGSVLSTTVPTLAERQGDFSALLGLPTPIQLYDPYSVNPVTGARTAYPNNQIPQAEWSKAGTKLWDTYFVPPTGPAVDGTNNFTAASPSGGNTNQAVGRGDYNLSDKTHVFGRFTYYGLTDLPTNPLGTGYCFDRCSEIYHTKAIAFDINHTFSPTVIFDLNLSGSRFVYKRAPILSGFDLTDLGWPASYNGVIPSVMRTPPTPAFPFSGDIGRSQGNSAIGDHNTQYNASPQLTVIRGKHTVQFGGQYLLGLDNYFQTNIASGAFGFLGSWTAQQSVAGGVVTTVPNTGFAFADFLLGLAQNGPSTFINQTEGAAQVPAQTQGRQTYRAVYVNDTWRYTSKLTLNLGLRWEFQGPWSERFNRLSYWDPTLTNASVTGCQLNQTTGLGIPGSPCIGDVSLVENGPNGSRNNIPLDKKELAPRLGFAYSINPKTVLRGGYGVFWVPNYVVFQLNPDNDVINLATTPFFGTLNHGLSPSASLDASTCTAVGGGYAAFVASCANVGPFGANGILPPPGRNGNTSHFVAANGAPTLAPYLLPKPAYVQQYNLDIQRQLPGGFFADVAYAGSHGVHLANYNPSISINQIPDSFISQAAAQAAAGQPVAIVKSIPNPISSPNAVLSAPTILAGQLDRPYPQYTQLNMAGQGCCGSTYNSLQVSVTRRFQGGGTLLVAYTNAKLMTNTDTLTSWLENGSTGTVGQVQDFNNLDGERSLSSEDVPQRLVVSYVLDLPFGKGKMWLNSLGGAANRVVSGWGVDGITTFQRGFPLKITWSGASTALSNAGFGTGAIRPDVVAGCSKAGSRTLAEWFNTACFSSPPQWGFGDEARVDSTLRADGINNFDFAIFKRTGITEHTNLEFRVEFFNLFNRVQFGLPGTGLGVGTFGVISSTNPNSNPRLIQLGLKFNF